MMQAMFGQASWHSMFRNYALLSVVAMEGVTMELVLAIKNILGLVVK